MFAILGSSGTGGGLYAGASAGQGIGASAALGGDVAGGGVSGGGIAEAHRGGVVKVASVQPAVVSAPAPVVPVAAAPASIGGQQQVVSLMNINCACLKQFNNLANSKYETWHKLD